MFVQTLFHSLGRTKKTENEPNDFPRSWCSSSLPTTYFIDWSQFVCLLITIKTICFLTATSTISNYFHSMTIFTTYKKYLDIQVFYYISLYHGNGRSILEYKMEKMFMKLFPMLHAFSGIKVGKWKFIPFYVCRLRTCFKTGLHAHTHILWGCIEHAPKEEKENDRNSQSHSAQDVNWEWVSERTDFFT